MKSERDVKGIWIPIEVWEDKNLTLFETALLAEIDSLDCGEGCWKSDEALAVRMRCSLSHLSNSIYSLKKRKYLKTIKQDRKNHRRFLRTTFSRFRRQPPPTVESRSHLLRKVGHDLSTIDLENTSGGKCPSTNGFFEINGEYTPFITKCSHRLEDYIRSSRKISPRFNRKKWYNEFRLLLQSLDGDKARIRRALKIFTTHPHDPESHPPEVECAESFRKKFLKIESWIKRISDQLPPEEENNQDGPIVTRTRTFA